VKLLLETVFRKFNIHLYSFIDQFLWDTFSPSIWVAYCHFTFFIFGGRGGGQVIM